jgi:hypothetical protein
MKKTSLFLYGNSRTDKSGRRREESGRKSREGTTDVGETGLYYSCDVKGGTRSGGGGRAKAFEAGTNMIRQC